MRMFYFLAAVACLCSSARAAEPSQRLQITDLKYLGAFRAPQEAKGDKYDFSYGGKSMAYNPKTNSLFLSGHMHYQLVAEISIPEPVKSDNVAALPCAKTLQPFAELTGSLRANPKDPYYAYELGNLLVYDDRLLWSCYIYYDAVHKAKGSHGFSSLDLSHPNPQGIYTLKGISPGAVGGYMCPVPEDWQARFGVPVLTGQAGIPIVTRTSDGPAAVGFDPAVLGRSPAPAQVFLYYPTKHPLDTSSGKNAIWNRASIVGGMAFISRGGKAGVLFFGRRGLGESWYGLPEEKGKSDRFISDKGPHAPPYESSVWFYDPNDLLAVKSGTKEPWGPRPYAIAKLPGAYDSGRADLGGAAYDARSGRLYVSQPYVDHIRSPYAQSPVIHVYELGGPAGTK